jgi:hypothetical protein
MKLEVPYYSQFLDIDDKFWMLRACGAVAMKSVAEFHGVIMPDLVAICVEAKQSGGYDMTNGWVHDYIVAQLQAVGLSVYRKEGLTSLEEISASLLSGNPVIVSVEKRVLEQTRFHIITLVGYEISANVSDTTNYTLQTNDYLIYHESESTDKTRGAYRKCEVGTFMNYWRGKVIVATKKLTII